MCITSVFVDDKNIEFGYVTSFHLSNIDLDFCTIAMQYTGINRTLCMNGFVDMHDGNE